MPRIRLAAVVVATLALGACKDATSPTSQMKTDEAQSLALMMAASGDVYAAAYPVTDVVSLETARAAMQPVNATYTASRPCPKGGTVVPSATITGNVDPVAHSATLDLTGSETRANCAYQVQTNTITVNGTLDITAHVNIVASLPSGAQTFTEKGSFTWTSSDGRSGTCNVDLSASAVFGTTMQRTVHAEFCGRTLDFTGTIG